MAFRALLPAARIRAGSKHTGSKSSKKKKTKKHKHSTKT